MRKILKHILLGMMAICMCNQISLQAMAQEEEVFTEIVDISDKVYQAGGFGDPIANNMISTYAVTARDRLKADIYQALKTETVEIDVSGYGLIVDDFEEIQAIHSEVINEHPELFYVKSYISYSYYSSGTIIVLRFFYDSYTDDQKQAYADTIADAMTRIDEDMTDLEKAIVLHDYLAQNCAYAYKEYLEGTLSQHQQVYSAYGALAEKRAVCQGYALAYSALLRTVGIDSYLCSSSGMNHAWNVVFIDGEWYHVDVTWDDPVWNTEGYSRHEYFLLSDIEMQNREHYGWSDDVECTSTKYDSRDCWWNGVKSQIYIGDKTYYIEELYTGFQLMEKAGDNATAKYENNSCWEVWNGSGSYWTGAYSYLSSQGEYLYFNDKANIYSMNKAGGTPQVIYTYTGGDGYIYGAMVYGDGTARLNISQTPNMNTDTYITVDLSADAPILNVNYEAGTISTTAAMAYSTDGGSTWKACTANMKLTDLGWNGSKSKTVLFKVPEAGGLFESDVTEVTLKALAGTTAGKLSCFGDATESVTIYLIDSNGLIATSSVVSGSVTDYGLGRVNAGTYTMQVSKKNHVTREYTVTIGDEALTQDVELHLVGDITGDGVINARDKKTMFNHISGSSKLNGYDFKVADVNGDGVINARDKKMLFNHISGSSGLWK